MIRALRLYREYRRQGLRRAWELSGMRVASLAAGRVVLLAAMSAAAAVSVSKQAEAIQEAADNRVAATIASQIGEIEEMRRIIAACLGYKEGAIFIGGELHLCKAVPTGIMDEKKKGGAA